MVLLLFVNADVGPSSGKVATKIERKKTNSSGESGDDYLSFPPLPAPECEVKIQYNFSANMRSVSLRNKTRKTSHAVKVGDVTKDCARLFHGIISIPLTAPGAPGVAGPSVPRAVAEEVYPAFSLVELLQYCALIGRAPTILRSHWSRAPDH